MFLFKNQENQELNPTDDRHISQRFDLDTALKILKPSERAFLKEHRKEIETLNKIKNKK
jgi:hypothetical protein